MTKQTASRRRPPSGPPRQVRIIGGQWKRTPLAVIDTEGLRPTPDRVRETVFNWLHHLLSDWNSLECLDLFAGTGALGFEAASRGARRVVMVESDTRAAHALQAAKEKLNAEQISVIRADALSFAARQGREGGVFDLIFLDPPFGQDWLTRAMPLCGRLLKPGGILYVEAEFALEAATAADELVHEWEVLRSGSAGMVHFHLLRAKNGTDFQA